MNDIHYLSIEALAKLIRHGEISSVSVTQTQLSRISIHDPDLRAYASICGDQALPDAQLADQQIANHEYRGPLHGVPIAVKDLCFTQGHRTSGGTAVLSDFVPKFDATVVTKLRQAGAIILGKLNLAEGAMAAYNPKFHAPINPWKRSLSPGGSSSGSGVATAAGLCFASLGTDTGGSIRFPASMCGVVGVKPTWGRVSRYGVLDLAPSMDHIGPMTRTVRDAAIMLDTVAGHDRRDLTTLPTSDTRYLDVLEEGVAGLRIGYAEQYVTEDVDPETANAVQDSVAALALQGASITDVTMPCLDQYLSAWIVLCTCEALVAHAEYFPLRASEYGPWFRSWLAHGSQLTASDYAQAHQQRLQCNAVVAHAFADIEVLVCPAMAAPELRKSDEQYYAEPMGEFNPKRQRFTIPYDFNGAPSITVPVGANSRGEPVGIQCIAKQGREDIAFRAARIVERAFESDRRHPDV